MKGGRCHILVLLIKPAYIHTFFNKRVDGELKINRGRCSKLSLLKKRDVDSQRTYFQKAKR